MPPDNSAGYVSSAPVRSTSASASRTRSAISSSVRSRRRSPSATLSNTDIESNSAANWNTNRSEEHTSELQSRGHLVCRLLLEKKNQLRPHNSEQHNEL